MSTNFEGTRSLPHRACSQFSGARLCRRDPIARLLLAFSGESVGRVTLLALAVYAVLGLACGAAISTWYPSALGPFLSIFDARELAFALFTSLVIAPAAWSFYTWQPGAILGVLGQLSWNEVISQMDEGLSLETFVEQTMTKPCNRTWNLVLAIVVTLTELMLWVRAQTPADPFFHGFPTTWFLVCPIYYRAVWLPLVFVNLYMLAWVIIRQTLATICFTRLFRAFEVTPKLLHPDRCNGLSAIGNFALRSALMAVLMGLFVSSAISLPVLWGGSPLLRADNIVMLGLYLVGVPTFLVAPTWEAHLAMSRAKARALEDVAIGIRGLLSRPGVDRSAESVEQIEHLERQYQLLDRSYRTWPFDLGALGRFAAIAVLPLLPTVVSFVLNVRAK